VSHFDLEGGAQLFCSFLFSLVYERFIFYHFVQPCET